MIQKKFSTFSEQVKWLQTEKHLTISDKTLEEYHPLQINSIKLKKEDGAFCYDTHLPFFISVYVSYLPILDIDINGQIFPLIFSKIAAIRFSESLCFLKTYGKTPKWFSPIFVQSLPELH